MKILNTLIEAIEGHHGLNDSINRKTVLKRLKAAKEEIEQQFSEQKVNLKKDLLSEIKISCDGTYSDNIDSWDFTETAESVINRINKTLDKHYK